MLKKSSAKNILVISVHPDDETLGAGGTLLKHKKSGDEVHCIFCTDIFENEGYAKEVVKRREEEIEKVSSSYKFSSIHRLGLKTCRVNEYPHLFIMEKFSKIFHEIKPEIIYLPYQFDAHSDHRIIFECAYACTKSFRYPFIEKVLMMEVVSESDFALPSQAFSPNVFINITEYMEEKINIMKIYKSEIGTPPFPRSLENIKSLAQYRGSTMGRAEDEEEGIKYAESFMLLKEIIR